MKIKYFPLVADQTAMELIGVKSRSNLISTSAQHQSRYLDFNQPLPCTRIQLVSLVPQRNLRCLIGQILLYRNFSSPHPDDKSLSFFQAPSNCRSPSNSFRPLSNLLRTPLKSPRNTFSTPTHSGVKGVAWRLGEPRQTFKHDF